MGRFSLSLRDEIVPVTTGRSRLASIASLVATSAAVFALGAALAVVFLHFVGDDSGLERVWEMTRLGVRVG